MKKYIKEILIVILLIIIIFLQRGCGSDYGDKEIVKVDGKDYELIKKETIQFS